MGANSNACSGEKEQTMRSKCLISVLFAIGLVELVGSYKGTFSNVAGVPGGIVRVSKTLDDLQITGGIVFRFGKS
jgi:hypothetical protein